MLSLEGIMKAYLYRTILATVVTISLGALASERFFAQACAPFPAGVVPFAMLHYISDPNFAGDRLMVGEMGGRIEVGQIPLPSFPNQKFCGAVEMAPGLFVEAYVPTQREFSGDFSAFGVRFFDPISRAFDPAIGEFAMLAFGANQIPPDRLYDLFAWRIPSSSRFSATLSIPIVLSLGGPNYSFYTSELTLANRGSADLILEFSYTAAFGVGSGKVNDTLPAGRQRILPDTLAYLRSLGLPITTSADSGGTLTVKATGLVSPSDIAVTVRTTTALAEGRASLAYSGNRMWESITGFDDRPLYICGLRQNATDRSNVAVLHAGNLQHGEIVLRLTVSSGTPPFAPRTLPDITLSPGGFDQINKVLTSNGLSLSNGYVRVERLSGTAPYFAYGVINDEVNSDGSFVPPMLSTPSGLGLTVPVMVKTQAYTSELILTNSSASQKKLDFSFVAEEIQTQSHSANFSIELSAGQQLILPDFVQYLRDRGVPGIGSAGTNYVGALFITIDGDNEGNDGTGIIIGARTSTPSKGGGRFGVFYPGVPLEPDWMATKSAWLYGLQQNSETRTNVALVNAGLAGGSPSTFRIELFDGPTGEKVNTIEGITLDSQGWVQIRSILDQFAPGTTSGYAHVIRTAGSNPFIAYAVVNDGAKPGERTGDGAFVSMQVDVSYAPFFSSGAGYWDY
jgi:hypothetical protein